MQLRSAAAPLTQIPTTAKDWALDAKYYLCVARWHLLVWFKQIKSGCSGLSRTNQKMFTLVLHKFFRGFTGRWPRFPLEDYQYESIPFEVKKLLYLINISA